MTIRTDILSLAILGAISRSDKPVTMKSLLDRSRDVFDRTSVTQTILELRKKNLIRSNGYDDLGRYSDFTLTAVGAARWRKRKL